MVSAAAFAACFPTGKLAASVAPADLPIAPNGFKPVEPIYPVIEPQKFPAWVEDYKWLRSEHLPQMVSYATSEPAGTVIVDTDSRYLYLIRGFGQAKRYGIGVGRDGFNWSGTATIERKRKWPMWYPPKEMQRRDKEARRWRKGMPGGNSQSPGSEGALSLPGTERYAVPHPWNARSEVDRQGRFIRLHPNAQCRRNRALRSSAHRHQGRGAPQRPPGGGRSETDEEHPGRRRAPPPQKAAHGTLPAPVSADLRFFPLLVGQAWARAH